MTGKFGGNPGFGFGVAAAVFIAALARAVPAL